MIKKITVFLLLAIVIAGTQSKAQYTRKTQVTSGEYFIDTDPGMGNAVAVVAEDGSFGSAFEKLIKNGINIMAPGLHTLNIRVKDSLDWGPVFTTVIKVEASLALARSVQVSQAELFWDTDPGQGLGTVVLAFDGNFNNAVETLFKSGITTPSAGKHTLNIRVKDINNNWGSLFTTIVSVENQKFSRSSFVSSAELFWDTDPGQGLGTTVLAFDGNFNNAVESVMINTSILPSSGKHKLSLRVKDAANVWGPVFTTVVSIENAILTRNMKVMAGEIFWDNDPGYGLGTPLLAFDGNFNDAVESIMGNSLSLPAQGKHKLSIRVKDLSNVWSPVFSTIVSIEANTYSRNLNIAQAEVFWDTDPGQGNGTPVLAYDGNFNNAVEALLKQGLTVPAVGKHTINIRVKDANNNWGSVFSTLLSVEQQLYNRQLNILQAEAFWDTDPGFGSGITLLAFDGTFNDAAESLIEGLNSSFLTAGYHKLNIRVKGRDNNWSPVFTNVIYVDACATSPTVQITPSGSTTFCLGDSIQLSATGSLSNYKWMKGSTILGFNTQSIYVSEPGFYTAIAYDGNGCPGTSTPEVITVIPVDPTINPSGTIELCQNEQVTLYGITGYDSYLWSDGGTGNAISVNTAGTYTLTVTDAGCTRISNPVTVVVHSNPATPLLSAGGPTTFCQGDSVVLTSSAGYAYNWTNGDTTQSSTIMTSGNQYVTVTNVFGCSSVSAPITVIVTQTTPTISLSGPSTICSGDTLILFAGGGYTTYSWSTGASTASINVVGNGTYDVTVTSGTCIGTSNPVVVSVNPSMAKPTISIIGNTTMCEGETAILTSSNANSYYWNNLSTGNSITVGTTGLYYVIASNAFGCSAISDPVNIVSINANPTVTYNGSLTICDGDTLTLYAENGFATYAWSSGETTGSIEVTQPGNYDVSVTNSGCSGISNAVIVDVNSAPSIPAVALNGPITFCQGDTVTLTSDVETYYNWNTGATTQSVDITSTGNYQVVVTNTFGCSATSAAVIVTVYPNVSVPTILAGSNTTFCSGDSVVLISSAATGNLWSNGGLNQTEVITQSGIYSVTTSNIYGCAQTSDTVIVTVVPVTTSITSSGSNVFCMGDSVVLSAGSGFTGWVWSNGSTTQNISVFSADSYAVTMTNAYCSKVSVPLIITVNSLPSIPVITANYLEFCTGDSVILTSSLSFAYLWSDGTTAQSTVADASGIYHVTAIDNNGCKSVSNDVITTENPNPIVPVITVNGPTQFCAGDTVGLSTIVASSYLWSTGDSTQIINVVSAGQYFVTVTNSFGCLSSSNAVTLTSIPVNIALTTSGPTEFCQGDSTTIYAGSGFTSWIWSNGATTQNITVHSGSNYYVNLSNAYCDRVSLPLTVTVNPLPTTPVISNGNISSICSGDSVIMMSSVEYAYLWSTGETTQSIIAKLTDLYSVIVENSYGCASTSSDVVLTVNPNPNIPIISISGPTTFCMGDSILLATDISYDYEWSTGDTVRQIKVVNDGLFNVTVTNLYGCSETSQNLLVEVNAYSPIPIITRNIDTLFATTSESYIWYLNGMILAGDTLNYVIAQPGNYQVECTDTNGCSAKSAIYVVTGMEEDFASRISIGAYPNPFDDFTTFRIIAPEQMRKISFRLYDMLGKEIKAIEKVERTFNLSKESLMSGVYFYKFSNENSIIGQGKLIVR